MKAPKEKIGLRLVVGQSVTQQTPNMPDRQFWHLVIIACLGILCLAASIFLLVNP